MVPSVKSKKINRDDNVNTIFKVLLLAFIICFFLSLSIGRYNVPLPETLKILLKPLFPLEKTWEDLMENVVLNVRLPRLIAAALTGGALALSGVTYQGLFRNPLVSPDLLGVSAGACVGAALAIIIRLNTIEVQMSALFFGLMAVLITTTIPKFFRNDSSLLLVLSGVIVGGFMSSVLGLLKYVADPEQELASIVYWTMGSFANIRISSLIYLAPVMIIAAIALNALRWRINLLSLGDKEAKSLGLNLRQIRGLCIVMATILTACAVCMSGTIGWVGLIIPHLGRLLVGQNHRYLMPASTILGATFMLIVDFVARNLTGAEIPLSILTGFIGGPLFIWLLLRQKVKLT